MYKHITIIMATAASIACGSTFAQSSPAKGKTPTSCNGKISTEKAIKTMSDVHLMRYWSVLLKDKRLKAAKSLNDVQLILRRMDNCDDWDDNQTYVVEVKWMLQAIIDNGLTNSFNRLATGSIFVRGEQILERDKSGAVTEWTPLHKNQD